MLTRQLAHWHNGRHDNLAVASHRGILPQNDKDVGTILKSLRMPRHVSMRLSMGGDTNRTRNENQLGG